MTTTFHNFQVSNRIREQVDTPILMSHEKQHIKQVPFDVYVFWTAKRTFLYVACGGIGVMTSFAALLRALSVISPDSTGWGIAAGILGGLGVAGIGSVFALWDLRKTHDEIYSVTLREKDHQQNDIRPGEGVRSLIHQKSGGRKHLKIAKFSTREMDHLRKICQVNERLVRDDLKGGFRNYSARWNKGDIQKDLKRIGAIDEDHLWTDEAVEWLFPD